MDAWMDVDGRENSIHYQGVVVFSSAELCAVFSPAQSSSADSLLTARYPEVITLPNHDDNYWPGSENHSTLCHVVHACYNRK